MRSGSSTVFGKRLLTGFSSFRLTGHTAGMSGAGTLQVLVSIFFQYLRGYTNDWIISHTIVSFRISPMPLNSRLMMLPERNSSVMIPIGRIPFCDKRRMPVSNTTATVRLQMLSMILALITLIFSMNNPFGDVPAPIL